MDLNWFIKSILLFLFLGSIIYALAAEFFRIENRRKRFRSRKNLSLEKLFRLFPEKDELDPSLFRENWMLIAKTLRIHPGKLRPTDRFDLELKPSETCVDDETDEVFEYFYDISLEKGLQIDFKKIKTIRDLILAFSKRQE